MCGAHLCSNESTRSNNLADRDCSVLSGWCWDTLSTLRAMDRRCECPRGGWARLTHETGTMRQSGTLLVVNVPQGIVAKTWHDHPRLGRWSQTQLSKCICFAKRADVLCTMTSASCGVSAKVGTYIYFLSSKIPNIECDVNLKRWTKG